LASSQFFSPVSFNLSQLASNTKPFTLSTGVVISDNLATLAMLLTTVIWLALSIGAVALLIGLNSLLRRLRVQTTA